MWLIPVFFLWLFLLGIFFGKRGFGSSLSSCLSGTCGSLSTLISTFFSTVGIIPSFLLTLVGFSTLLGLIVFARERPLDLLEGLDLFWMGMQIAVRAVLLPLLGLFRFTSGLLIPLWNLSTVWGGWFFKLLSLSLDCGAQDSLDSLLHLVESFRLFLDSLFSFLLGNILEDRLDLRPSTLEISESLLSLEGNLKCMCKSFSPLSEYLVQGTTGNFSEMVYWSLNCPISFLQETLLFLGGTPRNFSATHESFQKFSIHLGFYLDELFVRALENFWETFSLRLEVEGLFIGSFLGYLGASTLDLMYQGLFRLWYDLGGGSDPAETLLQLGPWENLEKSMSGLIGTIRLLFPEIKGGKVHLGSDECPTEEIFYSSLGNVGGGGLPCALKELLISTQILLETLWGTLFSLIKGEDWRRYEGSYMDEGKSLNGALNHLGNFSLGFFYSLSSIGILDAHLPLPYELFRALLESVRVSVRLLLNTDRILLGTYFTERMEGEGRGAESWPPCSSPISEKCTCNPLFDTPGCACIFEFPDKEWVGGMDMDPFYSRPDLWCGSLLMEPFLGRLDHLGTLGPPTIGTTVDLLVENLGGKCEVGTLVERPFLSPMEVQLSLNRGGKRTCTIERGSTRIWLPCAP